jgi:hypothetical protein
MTYQKAMISAIANDRTTLQPSLDAALFRTSLAPSDTPLPGLFLHTAVVSTITADPAHSFDALRLGLLLSC